MPSSCPKEGTARGVQIDIALDMLSLLYPMEVNLVGDSAQTLRALLSLLDRKAERSWRGHIEKNVAEWWRVPEARAHTSANPINPQRVPWELSSRHGDPQEGSVIVGTAKGLLSSILPRRGK